MGNDSSFEDNPIIPSPEDRPEQAHGEAPHPGSQGATSVRSGNRFADHPITPSPHHPTLAVAADHGAARAVLGRVPDAVHALDRGPMAHIPGQPWSPPVTAWPFADAAFARVLVMDELAVVVDDEAAIAEAARVLVPGGELLVRVPAEGPLAWLDAPNAARYLRDIARLGQRPAETSALGWRRHYREDDLREILAPHFSEVVLSRRGVGLAEAARLAAHLPGAVRRRDLPSDRMVSRLRALEDRIAVPGAGWAWWVRARRLDH
jgi:SAM-dependent methyltransferase